jgi:hypothetical protein
MIKTLDLKFHEVEERAETQTESMDNLFNLNRMENFPHLDQDTNTHVQKHLKFPIEITRVGPQDVVS